MKTQFACPDCHGPAALARPPKNGLRAQFACPHCKGPTSIKTSRLVSATLREVNYQCRDVECSYSFVVQAEAVRSLSPSGKPDPSINIPLSMHATALQRARAERLTASA